MAFGTLCVKARRWGEAERMSSSVPLRRIDEPVALTAAPFCVGGRRQEQALTEGPATRAHEVEALAASSSRFFNQPHMVGQCILERAGQIAIGTDREAFLHDKKMRFRPFSD